MIQELVELLVEAQLQEEVMWVFLVEQVQLIDRLLVEHHLEFINEQQQLLKVHEAVE